MTREKAIKVLEMFLHKQCDLGRTEFAYDQLTIWDAVKMASDALEQEPCKDAVSVASVFEIMGNLMSIPYDFDRSITEKDVSESMDEIRALPRVTPQEPRKGHWVTKPHVFGVAYCSECDFELRTDNTNFCPNCGTDMREVEK